MQNKYNLGMYDEITKQSVNFVPRHVSMNIQEWVEDSPMDEQQTCPPRKIFQRHGSLAELSTIAVTEKEALDRQENSQCSDSSESSATVDIENDSQGQEFGCSSQNVGAQLEVHSTPTKISLVENTPCNDPLTPTANLKMLMSVVSPAIRDRDEKKRDLFVNAENMSDEVVIEKPNAYSRKDKSLGLLCQRFLAMFPEDPGDNSIEISLDEVSKDLKVERRRVYDIVNVLESVEVLSRLAKNRYVWHGKSRIIQTLGKLKALSRNSVYKTCKKQEKENLPNTPTSGKQKMKRHFSCGDLPKPSTQSKERNLTKEEERLMIKAAIDSTDNCRKDKSLGVLSQKFLIMFLLSKGGVVTLEDAANVLLEEHDERNVKYKTKVRRLYDIANILSSLKLIEKVHIRGAAGKKPGFKWIGVDIDSLPENSMPSGNVMTFKTKHSLLPDPTVYPTANHHPTHGHIKQPYILPSPNPAHGSKLTPYKRWMKSASCSASFVRRSSSKDEVGIKRERSNTSTADRQDGFLVHEFASSPVNVLGHDMSLYSPTEVTFREEIQKLREKFPDRMSQLLAVLPPYLPSSCPGSANKTSRRNLFAKNKNANSTEFSAKRLRKNSEGEFHSVSADGESCTDTNPQAVGKDAVRANNENEDPSKPDNESKFMHSTNSPFKVMSSCAYMQSENQPPNPTPANMVSSRPVLGEISQQGTCMREPHQRSSCQWQHMVGRFTAHDGRTSPMVRLVDQAVSPIPPSKLAPRASIAIQTSLIKDISPLKPLVFLHHRIPSPWKPPAVSPSNIPPAPPSTPELPNQASMGPFQSQGNRMLLRSVSPYPASQSCSSSPIAPFNSPKLFFPPSPNATANGMVLPQGNLLYGVSHVPPPTMTPPFLNYQSHSCPPSVNPSPTPLDSGLTYTPGLVVPCSKIPSPNANVCIRSQTPQPFAQPASLTPAPEVSPFTPCQLQQPPTGKRPCMLMAERGLGETPSSTIDTTANENVSRKLCLASLKGSARFD